MAVPHRLAIACSQSPSVCRSSPANSGPRCSRRSSSSGCWRSRPTCCSAMPACSRSATPRSSRSRPIRRRSCRCATAWRPRSRRRRASLAGTLLAFVFAFAVRTRGVYFILITLAFGYIIWGVAYRWASFTGGDNGVTNVPFPAIGSLRVTGATAYYYVVLVVVLLCALGLPHPGDLAVRPHPARHQVERVAHAQPRLRRRPASLRRVRRSPACSRASPACSTSTTTASSIRPPRRFRCRSRPC